MKSEFQQNSSYTFRQLEPEQDWEIFKGHCERTHGENNYTSFIGREEAADPESWKSEMKRYVQFGLFSGDNLIGSTSLFSRGNGQEIIFTGSVIEREHRGQGLADQLYEARLSYVSETGMPGTIKVEIHEENSRSLKAAHRNGFEETGEAIQSGLGYHARYIVLSYQ